MYYIIYKTTCLVNNKIYIGRHETENKNDNYLGSGTDLQKDIKLFGKSNFKKEILFECSNGIELNQKEKEVVDFDFVNRLDTYNLICGGTGPETFKEIGRLGGNVYWKSLTLYEKKDRLKKLNLDFLDFKNKLDTDEEFYKDFCLKISKGLIDKIARDGHWWNGKTHTDETKKIIGKKNSISQAKEKNSQYGTCWIYNGNLKENKKIIKSDLDKWIQQGWIKGRKIIF